MQQKSTLPYFGGKRTAAPRIVAEIGPHRAFWSLCCGSLAVELEKPICEHEYVNDLNGDVVNLTFILASWEWCPTLYERLARVVCSQPLFEEAKAIISAGDFKLAPTSIHDLTELHVVRAYWYMIYSWQGMGGMAGTKNKVYFANRFTVGGGPQSVRFHGAIASIPWWHDRLRSINVLRLPAESLVPKIADEKGIVIYADPPYFEEGDAYVHTMTVEQHEALAAALCEKRNARCLVSYYDHPELDRLYAGWTKLDIAQKKQLSLANRRGSVQGHAPEVLLINGPSFTDTPTLF